MEKDWEAVARVIDARMRELDLTQAELAVRAGVATETIRELRTNLKPRRRNPRTLAAVSEALGWPPERLGDVLAGNAAQEPADGNRDGVQAEVARLRQAVDDLAERLSAVERQLGGRLPPSADSRGDVFTVSMRWQKPAARHVPLMHSRCTPMTPVPATRTAGMTWKS